MGLRKTYQVVAEQLHDQGAVLVTLLTQCVELCSRTVRIQVPSLGGVRQSLTGNGIIKRLLGKVASLVGSVEDLVVEDGEVEGKTQADGVGGGELGLGNLGGSLVGLEGLVGRVLAAVANGELGEVAVVVTLPAMGSAYSHRISGWKLGGTYILW